MSINKPFTHYVCDVCGKEIENPCHALFVWDVELSDDQVKTKNCQIIHKGKCDHNKQDMSWELGRVIGMDGIGFWTEHMGGYHQTGLTVDESWAECMTRCIVPRYEQARQFRKGYEDDGYQMRRTGYDAIDVLGWAQDRGLV